MSGSRKIVFISDIDIVDG